MAKYYKKKNLFTSFRKIKMMQSKKLQKFSEQFINFNSQVIQLNQAHIEFDRRYWLYTNSFEGGVENDIEIRE